MPVPRERHGAFAFAGALADFASPMKDPLCADADPGDDDDDDDESSQTSSECEFRINGLSSAEQNRRTEQGLGLGTVPATMLKIPLRRLKACFVGEEEEPPRTGLLASIVCSNAFGALCTFVIMLNAIMIAIAADHEIQYLGEPAPGFIAAMELGFAVFYTVEMVSRLAVHRLFFFFNSDMAFNIADLCLVITSLAEIIMASLRGGQGGSSLAFLRLVRICKMAKVLRVFRTVRFFRELRLIVDCVLGSFLNAFWSIVMLVLFFFLFGLIINQGLAEYMLQNLREGELDLPAETISTIRRRFGSVLRTVITLFQSTTAGLDWDEAYKPLEDAGPFPAMIFLLFITLFVVSVWNIVTSMFLEHAMKLAQPDLESMVSEAKIRDVADTEELKTLFSSHLQCNRRTGKKHRNHRFEAVNLQDFRAITMDSHFRRYLSAKGIDIKNVEVFFRMLLEANNCDYVNVADLAHACVRMKGVATSIDLQTVSFQLKTEARRQAKSFKQLLEQMRDLRQQIEQKNIGIRLGPMARSSPTSNHAAISEKLLEEVRELKEFLGLSKAHNQVNSASSIECDLKPECLDL